MNLDKINSLKDRIFAHFEAIKNIEFINSNTYINLDKFSALIVSTIEALTSSSDIYYISINITKLEQILNTIFTFIDRNIIPYIKSEPHKSHLMTQFNALKTYVYEIQNLLINFAILGQPMQKKGVAKTTPSMISKLETVLTNNFENMNDYKLVTERNLSKLHDEISNLNNRLESSTNNIEKQSNDQLVKLRSDVNAYRDKISKSLSEFEKAKSTIISSSTIELNKELEKAKEIVKLISDSGLTSEYGKSSQKYRIAKMLWQFLSLSFLVLTAILGIISMFPINILNVDLTVSNVYQLGIRLIIALSLGSAAAYSARQAHKNFRLEVRTKLIYLDLLTLDSFINDLEDKSKLKGNLVSKYFGRHEYFDTKDTEDDIILTPKNIEAIAKAISDQAKK